MRRQITGFSNPTVKAIRALRDKKHRREEQRFLAEGLRLLTDARESGRVPETLLMAAGREPHSLLVQIAAGLLVGGALGNVVDRVLYGAVADFLNMSCCGIDNPFAFNIADVGIAAGAVGLIVFSGREKSP